MISLCVRPPDQCFLLTHQTNLNYCSYKKILWFRGHLITRKLQSFTITNKIKEVTAVGLPVELAQPKKREIIFRKKINYLRIHGAFETFYSVNTGITCISIILLHNSVFPMNSFNRFIFDNTTWGQGFDEWFE